MFRPGSRGLSGRAALVLSLSIPLALAACGQGGGAADGAASVAGAPAYDAQTMLDNVMEQAATSRDKLVGLAEAIPEEAYDWRPAAGVRSVAEVFKHVAADNYLIPAMAGVAAPEETGITMDYATVQAYEARAAGKAEIVAALSASFDHLDAAVAATRGDLSASAVAFGTEFTMGGLWTMAVTHLHEHLGQTIAYARSNGVVPPWSR